MSDRLAGLLLFLPVPIVLFLFAQAPLGALPSLGLGVVLVATHRLYARPFALARAGKRCLWCGRAIAAGPDVDVLEPFGPTRWRACGAPHEERLLKVLGFASAHANFLRVGILGTLGAFLIVGLAAGLGLLASAAYADGVAFFRAGIAFTVLPFGFLAPVLGPRAGAPTRVPFPLHIQALIGTLAVLWLFRIVGIVWLVLGARHALMRLGAPLL